MYEIPGFTVSVKTIAAQDDKYVFVKMGAGGISPATAAADNIIGVVQRLGNAGEVLPVMTSGISMMVASAAIPQGSKVTAAAGGKAVVATTTFAGVAMEAATAAGDIIPVLL